MQRPATNAAQRAKPAQGRGSVQMVREFRAANEAARKVYANKRASVFELEQQIKALGRHFSLEDLLRLSLSEDHS